MCLPPWKPSAAAAHAKAEETSGAAEEDAIGAWQDFYDNMYS